MMGIGIYRRRSSLLWCGSRAVGDYVSGKYLESSMYIGIEDRGDELEKYELRENAN